jgi:adenylate cyclase
MDAAQVAGIARWVTEAGLAGAAEPELLRGFCERLAAAGLPVARVNILIDTLHPIHEGRLFRWRRDQLDLDPIIEYGRTDQGGEAAEGWRRSTYYHLSQSGEDMLRRRIGPGHAADFSILEELQAEGQSSSTASRPMVLLGQWMPSIHHGRQMPQADSPTGRWRPCAISHPPWRLP